MPYRKRLIPFIFMFFLPLAYQTHLAPGEGKPEISVTRIDNEYELAESVVRGIIKGTGLPFDMGRIGGRKTGSGTALELELAARKSDLTRRYPRTWVLRATRSISIPLDAYGEFASIRIRFSFPWIDGKDFVADITIPLDDRLPDLLLAEDPERILDLATDAYINPTLG